jgi:beta-lactamase regulating signal transducer with metallopeptidase domain
MNIDTLGWTLVHFLWQGAAIGLLLLAVDAALNKATSRARYAAACVAMLLMVCSVGVTFVWLDNGGRTLPQSVTASPLPAPASWMPARAASSATAIPNLTEWFAYFWLIGVLVLSMRSLGGWVLLERHRRRATTPAETHWLTTMAKLAERLRISRAVRLCESALTEVPAVIGWIRPVVLFPLSAFSGLTAEQMEALLAHELAHIRRHDYLVNLLQTCAETLLFYHPAVWWVGRRMRAERENCCDDLAVEMCGDAVSYACALAQMEHLRSDAPALAMAANRGSLLERIQRLLPAAIPTTGRNPDWAIAAVLGTIVCIGILAPRAYSRVPAPQSQSQSKAAVVGDENDFLGEIEKAGYRDLTVDQLVSLKIHDVTGEYIREIREAGYKPTIDDLVSLRIHGITDEYARLMADLGMGKPSLDELITLKIHGVDPGYAKGWKQIGVGDLSFDKLTELRIHGAEPDQIKKIEALGFPNLSADQIVTLMIHGVTVDFVEKAVKHGFHDSIEKIVELRQFGILE